MTRPDTLTPTPLAPLYSDGVAEWMDVFGFAIPVTWGDPGAEYDAIRNHVAVIEFSMLLKYDVTGPGAADCLNRVFSRDVTAMKPGRVAYGVVVTPEGHMIDDCTVFYHSPERVMVMGANPRLGEDLTAAAGLGVTVRECRADYAQISVQGPNSRALLQELASDDLSNAALPYYDFRNDVTIARIPMQISRLGFTGELGYELLLPLDRTPDLWAALTAAGQKHGLRPVGAAGLMMTRVEAGLIMGGLDYDETSTPWECRMGWAVNLSKPDFQGKAALIALKGGAQITLVSIAFPAGTEGLDRAEITVEGKPAGTISMAVPSPAIDGKMLGLARIDKASAMVGTTVSSHGYSGTVVAMPVYDPDRKRARG